MAYGAGPAHAAADAGVSGQWQFDEPHGQLVVDNGPRALHGLLGASELPDPADPARVAGLSGGAMHFDGNTFIRLPDSPQLASATLTVEAVVRGTDSPGAYRYVLSRGSHACFSGAYGLYTAANGGIAFYIFDGERYFVSSAAHVGDIWDGAWHTVTGAFDGKAVRVFIDGRLVGTALTTPPDTAIGYDQGPENTYVGTYIGTCTLPFIGDVDSIRIWSEGKTAQEVAAAAGLQPVTASPPAPRPSAAEPTILEPAALPTSSCTVKVSRKTITARSRSRITVRAARGGRPLKRVRVAVRRAGQKKILASKRTNSKGQASMLLKVARKGRLRVSVSGNSTCLPAYIRVTSRS